MISRRDVGFAGWIVAVSLVVVSGCDCNGEPEEPGLQLQEDPEVLPETIREPSVSRVIEGRASTGRVFAPKPVLEQIGEHGEPIDYEAEEWPEPFHDLKAVEVLTTDGPGRLELTTVETLWDEQGTQQHQVLVTEPTDRFAEQNLSWTFVAAPGKMPSDAAVRDVVTGPVDASVAREIWEQFIAGVKALDHSQAVEAIEETGKADASDEALKDHFNGVELDVVEQFDQLVTVRVVTEAGPCVSAGYLVGGGDRLKTAKEPQFGAHCFSPEALVDRDGEGDWEIIYPFGEHVHPHYIKAMGFDDEGHSEVERLKRVE